MPLFSQTTYSRRLLLLVLFTTIFRLVYINFIELAPDEAYYWDLSRRLQLSYYDHPPMLMAMIAAFTKMFGNSVFVVRLPIILISAAVSILVYLTGRELFDEQIGFYASLVANTVLIYSVGGIIGTVDTPFALFWLIAVYSGIKALKTGEGRWWYLKDAALGLGMLSKYIMVLFVPAFLIFILLSKEHRHWLRRKEPYIGSIIALIVFSPVLIWNAQNGWASFRFQLSHGLEVKERAGLPSFLEYLGSQAGILSPFLFIACVWAMARSLMVWLREKDWRYLYLLSTSSFVVIFFGYSSFRAKVEGNWPMTAYFTTIVALVSLYSQSNYQKKGILAGIVIWTSVVITGLAHIQAVFPLVVTKKDPTNELHRWKELGAEAGRVIEELKQSGKLSDQRGYFVLSTSHQVTAEMSFYIPSQPFAYELGGEGKFNQYNMWESPKIGSDAVLISAVGREDYAYINSLFDEIKDIKIVESKRGGMVIKTYAISYCRNFLGFRSS